MTDSDLNAQEWELGLVAWYLRDSQLDLYEKLQKEKFPFIECARRFGKTNSILAFVLEMLRQNSGWICRWCFPNKNQAREVISAEMDKMQKDCPPHLRFKYQVTDSVYNGPNGSKLFIRGVNEDRGNSSRGPAANIIVCDEYGFWNEPSYIVREVLFPQLELQPGQWLIKASTPPPNLGHRYYEEREEAIRKGRFIQKTIYDNEALSKEELAIIIEESGGVESPAFRRERLCEPVSDPKMLVCPEWNNELNTVPDDYPRPEFFTPYVAGDSGADDNTAILFGYHDFLNNEVVIEYEIVKNGKPTKFLVRFAKRIERALWGKLIDKDRTPLKVYKRVYDASKQLILDIFVEHKWPVMMPEKQDKLAAIHEFRIDVGKRKFKVKERCVHTRRQLAVGMWQNEKHLDFERTEGLGHLDALAAAIYFNRSIDTHHNPWPLNPGVSVYSHFTSAQQPSSLGKTEQALKSVFGKTRRPFT